MIRSINQTRSKLLKQLTAIFGEAIIPLLYYLWLFYFFPFRDVFWLDLDEGINLVKAQMVLRGFALYSQIWSDQPPLFTYTLAALLRYIDMQASVGRVFVLLLTCGLIWAAIHYLKMVWGKWHAATGVILLLLVPRFVYLSVSVMVGLPAIVFAVLSMLALTYWHIQRKYHWIVISAVALAVSVQIKIFTAFLAPIYLLGIIAGEWIHLRDRKTILQTLRPALVWGAIFTILVGLVMILIVKPGNFDQLFGSHLDAYSILDKISPKYRLGAQLNKAWFLLALAVLGAVVAVLSKRWLALYPVFWMIAALLLLWNHVPVWYHQLLLITIPAAIMAAGGIGEALNRLASVVRSRFALTWLDALHLISIGLFAYFIVVRVPGTLSPFQTTPILTTSSYKQTTTEAKFMNKVLRYAPATRWMVTDMPMYAFYGNIPVPPGLVVFSSKRLETGNLTEEQILQTIMDLGAEQVLLGRYELPQVRAYLRKNYQLVNSKDGIELYVSPLLYHSNP